MNETDRKKLESLKDPKFFIETFFSIVDKYQRTVPFLFNPPQISFYARLRESLCWLILKSRKEGFSSLIEAIWLHACIFFSNTKAVVMAQTQEETKVHRDRIDFYLRTMGTQFTKFEITLKDNNQTELYFPSTNSVYWMGTAGARSFGRSRDVTHLHATEVAHYEDQDVMTGVLNACTPNAVRIIETTTNGVGELFHRLWQESDDPQSGSPWRQFFSGWFEDPTNYLKPPANFVPTANEIKMRNSILTDYQITISDGKIFWYRCKESEQTDKSKMAQEFPSNPREAFISSGRHFLNLERIREMEQRCCKPQWQGDLFDDGAVINFVPNSEGELKIWTMPKDGECFLITADVAEGVKGGCFSVAKVFNRSSWEMVSQWRGRIDPGKFGKVMVDMGYFFNNAILCPEMNNHGFATLEKIKTDLYPHILNTKDLWPDETMEKDGFPTDARTREKIFSALVEAIDRRLIVDRDLVTIQELRKLVKNVNGKVVVESGYMDCAITLAIGAYVLRFVTVADTYRRQDQKSFYTTSLVPVPTGKTGYR